MAVTRSHRRYADFDPARSVRPLHQAEGEITGAVLGWDPGWAAPSVWVRILITDTSRLHIDRCLQFTRTPLPRQLQAIDRLDGPPPLATGVDPAARATSLQTGRSDADVLQAHGLQPHANPTTVNHRLAVLHSSLRASRGYPLLTIDPTCEAVASAIALYAGWSSSGGRWHCTTPHHGHRVDATTYGLLAALRLAKADQSADTQLATVAANRDH